MYLRTLLVEGKPRDFRDGGIFSQVYLDFHLVGIIAINIFLN